ncbi:MAG: hypothetical protein ACR2QO_20455 [Acidimicrobiales bacterium]
MRTLGPRTGEIVSAPPGPGGGKKRKGKKPNPLFQGSKPDVESRRRSRAAAAAAPISDAADEIVTDHARVTDDEQADDAAEAPASAEAETDPLTFEVSRQMRSMPVTALPGQSGEALEDDAQQRSRGDSAGTRDSGPASRPARRRDVADDDELDLTPDADDEADDEDDKFPWHYQFDDDEPQELQAKSPLLSRAFRSSVG